MIQDYLILETKVRKCAAEARINGIPICRVGPSGPLDSRAVHEFLFPGRNRFTLSVEPGPTPSQALSAAAEPFIPGDKTSSSLRLMSMPRGAFPEDPGVHELFRIDWTPPPGQPVETPAVLERVLEMPNAGHRWQWLDGEPFDTAASLQAVTDMLTECRDGMNRGDPEPFIERAQARFRAMLAAYGLDVSDEIAIFREEFRSLAGEAGFQMQGLDPLTMDLRVCADEKLVDCVDRSWEPLLRSAKLPNGVTRLRYPIKVARLGGTVQVVL